jgi:hypothetical protein
MVTHLVGTAVVVVAAYLALDWLMRLLERQGKGLNPKLVALVFVVPLLATWNASRFLVRNRRVPLLELLIQLGGIRPPPCREEDPVLWEPPMRR